METWLWHLATRMETWVWYLATPLEGQVDAEGVDSRCFHVFRFCMLT